MLTQSAPVVKHCYVCLGQLSHFFRKFGISFSFQFTLQRTQNLILCFPWNKQKKIWNVFTKMSLDELQNKTFLLSFSFTSNPLSGGNSINLFGKYFGHCSQQCLAENIFEPAEIITTCLNILFYFLSLELRYPFEDVSAFNLNLDWTS